MIGRKKERAQLLDAFKSEYSEFVAVYGRRRVGKTFLIRETFNYTFAFQHAGVKLGGKEVQLERFISGMSRKTGRTIPAIGRRCWIRAFTRHGRVLRSSGFACSTSTRSSVRSGSAAC